MVTNKHGRAAAWAAVAILAASAGVQFYWELHEVFRADPPSASDQFSIVFIGVVALWFAVVLLVRVGYLPRLAQFAAARINAWVIVAVSLGGALGRFAGPTDFDRFIAGPVNLIIALLAFVVACSERPVSPRAGHRQR